MTQPMEETRPRNPFHEQQADDDMSGPGCFVWGCFSVFALVLALAIVGLAGAAGWTEGHRIADETETVKTAEFVNEQLRRIPTDLANGNEFNVQKRLESLMQITPAVPQVAQIQAAATSLHINNIPTATPTPTMTPTDTPTVEVTEFVEPTAISTTEGGGFDLDALIADARDHINFGEYEKAYEKLDIIIRLDPNYQRTTVRALTNQVLVAQAEALYRTPDAVDLAEAIRLTDLAEQYGPIGELDYERILAGYYLDVMRTAGTGDHGYAINVLNNMRAYQTEYKGINLNTMLYNEYVAYAEAWEFGGQYCEAVTYYNYALNLFGNQSIQTKRDEAQEICITGTPTPIGGVDVPTGEAGDAQSGYPGVPPTPGG